MNFGLGFQEFLTVSEISLSMCLPFYTTHLCEAAFSALMVKKSGYQWTLILQDQVFSQDLILHIKQNMSIHPISVKICFFL